MVFSKELSCTKWDTSSVSGKLLKPARVHYRMRLSNTNVTHICKSRRGGSSVNDIGMSAEIGII